MVSITKYILRSRALDGADDRRYPFDEYPDLGAIPSAGWIRYIDSLGIGAPIHQNWHKLPFFDKRAHHEIRCMNDAQTAQRSCKMSVAFADEYVVARTFQRDSFLTSTELKRLHETRSRRKVSDDWHVLLNDLARMFRYAVSGQ